MLMIWTMICRPLRMTRFLLQGKVRMREYWYSMSRPNKMFFWSRDGRQVFCDRYMEKDFFSC